MEETVRELIKGDYILEVEGDYTQKIHGNHLVKVGARTGGGNREEEIKGNHAQILHGYRNTHIVGDEDILIDGRRLTAINDTDGLLVVNDIGIDSATGSIVMEAKENLSTMTKSGITTFKSGGKLNLKSAAEMHIKSETTLIENVGTNKTSTTGTTWSHTSTGAVTIVGVPINLNP